MADDHADFAVEQNSGVGLNAQKIGGGTGGNFQYKKRSSFFCVFFSSICSVLSSYFEGNISTNLVQPLDKSIRNIANTLPPSSFLYTNRFMETSVT